MKRYPVKFKEKKGKGMTGTCILEDRENQGEIIIYSDSDNKLRTLIHETIHNYLFEKKGGNRMLQKLNNDEKIIEEMSDMIEKNISDNKEGLF